MSLITRKITNAGDPFCEADGTPIGNAKITFTLVNAAGELTDAWDTVTGERVAPIKEVVYTAAVAANGLQIGEFEISLWPNDRGDTLTYYRCEVGISGVQCFSAALVSGAGSVQWIDFKASTSALSANAYNAPLVLTYANTLPVTGIITDVAGTPKNITGYTLSLDVTNSSNVTTSYPITITTPLTGAYSIDLSALAVGRYSARMQITNDSAQTVTGQAFIIEVIAA